MTASTTLLPHPDPLPFSRRILKIGLLLTLGYELICYLIWLAHASSPRFGDFFGLWSAGGLAAAGGAVYDPVRLQAFERLADPNLPHALYYIYLYPPSFLLVLAPLGLLPLGLAYALWMAATFALYVGATLGRHWRSWSGVALLAAPTTLIALISGQNGFLTAALLVGGLRCLERAPVAAGVLFGLLSYKPQYGLLVPVALLAARQWRAIVAACVTAATCMAASAVLFGPSIWRDWFDSLALNHRLMTDNQPSYLHLMPTVAATVEQATGSAYAGDAVQAVATLAVAAIVWRCFARNIERGIVPLLIGTVLATPYGFIYDLPMIAAALLLEWHWRRDNRLSFPIWEAALAAAFFEGATIMSAHSLPLAVAAMLAALFATSLRVRAAT